MENNILNHEFELVASYLSDANTNNTTLFSKDTLQVKNNVMDFKKLKIHDYVSILLS